MPAFPVVPSLPHALVAASTVLPSVINRRLFRRDLELRRPVMVVAVGRQARSRRGMMAELIVR